MPNYLSFSLCLRVFARQLLQVGEPAQRTGLPLREAKFIFSINNAKKPIS
ncbi:hypothetical protein [Anabaena sp. CCY 9614]